MIEAEKANYTVSRMCGMLEVSRAGSTNAASPAKAGRRNSGVPSWTPRSLTSIGSDGVYGARASWPICGRAHLAPV